MIIIGPGLGDDVHLRAQRETVFAVVAAVGKVNFLDAIHARPRNPGLFLPFRFQKAVDVAARGILAVHLDIQSGENVLQAVDAALEKSGRVYRTRRYLEKGTHVPAIDWQVRDLIRVQSRAHRRRSGIHSRGRTGDFNLL